MLATLALTLIPATVMAMPQITPQTHATGTSTALPPLRDEALRAALLGAWCNSSDEGRSCWAWDVFSDDGQLQICGRFPDDGQPFRGVGAVTVSGDRMCYEVLEASDNFWLAPGDRYCSRITGISDQAHTWQDNFDAPAIRLSRVPQTAVVCPDLAR